ncbi:peritrophin-1-like protein [Dinothrombium tinctorium]|uniref:Peritrophin-1-like protein n=1 Tax=Dinothrombium tinctorium TaxID=1965070 RepID=A0A3S3P4T0_9ACAR|nr:peritrophin-1-like protein [Dinothrombium tinctorium]RWS03624.1 peritrophin-1-like protein [Dinothrombium tinctorium]RWS05127.1 peritrophin-1-like protein [Dinothrombium tinctorium]
MKFLFANLAICLFCSFVKAEKAAINATEATSDNGAITTINIRKCHCGPCTSPNGLFPDPKSCCYFLQCSHCEAHLQKCPPGTQFNPYKLECDWPERAHCKSVDKSK